MSRAVDSTSPATARQASARFTATGSWRAPQHRDGMALVVSSALSSGVGLLFWVVAARLFDTPTVGLTSTVVATMTMLSTAAQLNLGNAMLRFVPVMGRTSRSFVLSCYAVGIAAATAAGAVFALGGPLWAPELVTAFGWSALVAFFLVATPIGTMFVLQDYVLPAIKRATVVPVENLAFAILKIVLLVVAAWLAVPGGIAVSWVVATTLVVIAITVYLFRELPPSGPAGPPAKERVTGADVIRFVRSDYAGTVFWLAALFGLPIVVLGRLGPDAAAVYNIVWQIAFGLYLVAQGMGQSLVAHVAGDPDRLERARDGMVTKALALIVPAVLVAVPGAHLGLALTFGQEYAQEGAALLVLLVVSAVPNAITAAAVWSARVRRDGRVLFWVPAGISTTVIAGSWILMPIMGVLGVGVAWLAAQTVAALVVLVLWSRWKVTTDRS